MKSFFAVSLSWLFLFFIGCSLPQSVPASPYSLPAYIPATDRAEASSIVVVADVVTSSSRNLNQTIDSAVVVLEVKKILKSPDGLDIPQRLNLQFALYPGSFEARMRTPPEPGRYFVFLNVEKAEKKDGKSLFLFRLYEPNPFAFDLWSADDEEQLIDFISKEPL